MPSRSAAPGLCSALPRRASSDRFTASCKAHGLLAWWKRSGRQLPRADGGFSGPEPCDCNHCLLRRPAFASRRIAGRGMAPALHGQLAGKSCQVGFRAQIRLSSTFGWKYKFAEMSTFPGPVCYSGSRDGNSDGAGFWLAGGCRAGVQQEANSPKSCYSYAFCLV